jgi:hypothetical protein
MHGRRRGGRTRASVLLLRLLQELLYQVQAFDLRVLAGATLMHAGRRGQIP